MIKKVHIFHHNDADGKFSAALMYQYIKHYKKQYRKTAFYEIDYIKEINLEDIPEEDLIVFVDYSFSNEHNLEQLKKAHKRGVDIIWIDHHKSSEKVVFRDFSGGFGTTEFNNITIVYDNVYSATALTWMYCREKAGSSTATMPEFIYLVNNYDLWNFSHGDNTELFNYGMRQTNYNPKSLIREMLAISNTDDFNIFTADIDDINTMTFSYIQDKLKIGSYIISYDETRYAHDREFGMFKFQIKDERYNETYNCLGMNIHSNSSAFSNLYDNDDVDIVCPFVMNKDGIWKYSLFCNDKFGINLGNIASILGKIPGGSGGGGHAKAAGFHVDHLIIKPNTIITIKKGLFGNSKANVSI